MHSHANANIYCNVSDMHNYMEWADLLITAGGSTCWEAVYMGLPMIVVSLAENQMKISKALQNHGAAIGLGWFDEISVYQLSRKILYILKDKRLLTNVSRNAEELVDGKGIMRVIDTLTSC